MKTEQTRIYPKDLLYLDELLDEVNKKRPPRNKASRADLIELVLEEFKRRNLTLPE